MAERIEVETVSVETGPPPPRRRGGGLTFFAILPGLSFIALGVLVLLLPRLLEVLVAVTFIVIGVALLGVARRVQRMRRRAREMRDSLGGLF